MSTDFADLSLKPALLDNLASLGYDSMTPIQALSLPAILNGQDVVGKGKTGSGKTAAFGLGLLNKLDVKRFRVQCLVLCPTRELAEQVAESLRKLARQVHNIKILTLCGGQPMGPQIGSLEHGAHIIVGTPGRVENHLRNNRLNLEELNTLVLDEADRMLDMGFEDQIDEILTYVPTKRQTLLFSATYPDSIQSMANNVMSQPVMVEAPVTDADSRPNIEEYFYAIEEGKRFHALQLVLLEHEPDSAIVFCNTKVDTQRVSDELCQIGFAAIALHGDLDQREREQALALFSNQSATILVATDVAARGLDIDDLDMVVNYDVAHEAEVHTHRIGRTGRAGKQGVACTLYGEREHRKLAALADPDAGRVDPLVDSDFLPSREVLKRHPARPRMRTLQLDGGKRQKIRPGDIVGALTNKQSPGKQISGQQIGVIQVLEVRAYVAVEWDLFPDAITKLREGKLKGKSVRVRGLTIR